MKKWSYGLTITLAISFTACGGGGGSSDPKNQDEQGQYSEANGKLSNKSGDTGAITFDNSGAYDLKEYFLPSSTQTNLYEKSNGIDNNITYTINANIVTINNEDEGETNLTISSTKLSGTFQSSTLGSKSYTMSYARHIDIGDAFLDINKDTTKIYDDNINCELINHLDTKNFTNTDNGSTYTFNDLLEVKCTDKIHTKIEANGHLIEETYILEEFTGYYAKNTGFVVGKQTTCKEETNPCEMKREVWEYLK